MIGSEGELDASSIGAALADAIERPVRFTGVLARLEQEGVRRVIVCAPSRVVRSLVRRTLRDRVELSGAD
jgi:malonyl CoA-acyl carrier protein transacylase